MINLAYVASPKEGGGYVRPPQEGVLVGGEGEGWVWNTMLGGIDDVAARQLAYVLLKICCFVAGAWVCARRGIFWKL